MHAVIEKEIALIMHETSLFLGKFLLIFNQKLILEDAKLKKLNFLMQDCSLYLGKANLMQKFCKRGPQSSEIFGQKFQ